MKARTAKAIGWMLVGMVPGSMMAITVEALYRGEALYGNLLPIFVWVAIALALLFLVAGDLKQKHEKNADKEFVEWLEGEVARGQSATWSEREQLHWLIHRLNERVDDLADLLRRAQRCQARWERDEENGG